MRAMLKSGQYQKYLAASSNGSPRSVCVLFPVESRMTIEKAIEKEGLVLKIKDKQMGLDELHISNLDERTVFNSVVVIIIVVVMPLLHAAAVKYTDTI